MPQWVAEMQTSDWLLFAFAAVLIVFILDYGLLTPWWRDPMGYVVLGFAIGYLLFTILIIYGVVAGQRVDEWARTLVMMFTLLTIIGKEIILRVLKHEGKIARRERRLLAATDLTERQTMSTELPTDVVKSATEIWYKSKRVLRTFVQVVIPAFLGFAVVFPLIIEAAGLPVDSELRLWLVAFSAGVSAVAAGIARIMAIPAVNAWLIKIGLGSVPKSALEPVAAVNHQATAVVVVPDPKVADPERYDG